MLETALADRVMHWYGAAARDLPWRRAGTTPWGVLVSEIMLAQTQVARVVPAWHGWLERWPTPPALAAEPPGEAVRAWGRLGYPRRALWLHAAAVLLVHRHGGQVPSSVAALLELPGVGAYTARAVATFAFGQRHGVVDTNVRRVVARAVEGIADAAVTARDVAAVEALLPPDDRAAAVASAAIMELGALVCTARAPRCADCPIAASCAWRAAGHPALAVPVKRRQGYPGSDRQVRGRLLAVLRDTDQPVDRRLLAPVWDDAAQRDRALDALVADGLVSRLADGRYWLPA